MIDIDNAIAVLQAVKAGKKVMFRSRLKMNPVLKLVTPSHHFDFTYLEYTIQEEQRSSSESVPYLKPAPVSHYVRVKPRIRTLPYGYIQNDAGRVFS